MNAARQGVDVQPRTSFQDVWMRAARMRQLLFVILVLVPAGIAAAYMASVLPHRGSTGLELAVVMVFGVLFAWISMGFWMAMAGLFTLARRYDRFAVTRDLEKGPPTIDREARTAVLMPIANEEVARALKGLGVVYRSLEQTGWLERFDFFVLSDSASPDKWVEEEAAWADLCQSVGGFNRIFYRRRRANSKRKSGNIADFCRRWGRNYRYMVVLDADSIMSGATLVSMVRLMEQRPRMGMLQTAPAAVNRETLLARVQQFANHVYGPMFAAGLHFWQLGDSQFWGHNAIIRVAPFMQHCALPRLPGKPPLGGDILSHDFVEAALMRRAGWEVWLAHELAGSYEEVPPSLLDELKRDRRWCQGNMQHMRLLFTRGLFPAHRALFLNGAMAYISALLWFLFLALSTAMAIYQAVREPTYFPSDRVLFPQWPVWEPQWALILLATTFVILFLPKLFSILLILFKQGQARLYGGAGRLALSVALEAICSTLLAPTRMLFHSKFVFMILLGQQVGWGPQHRDDSETTWREAARFHGLATVLGLLWGTVLFLINRSFFWWLTPIVISLVLSLPLSVWSSRASLGLQLRKWGLLLIPEESDPPQELRGLESPLPQKPIFSAPLPLSRQDGFIRAIVDPHVNALHLAMLRGKKNGSATTTAHRQALREKALALGPDGLDSGEKTQLLYDAASVAILHRQVWELSDRVLAQKWGLAPWDLAAHPSLS
jgi:membrane glycosyltransferase